MEETHSILGDARLWVGIGFFLFMGLSLWKLLPHLTKALDAYSSRISQELKEAKALRAEAETLLKAAKEKAKTAESDARAITKQAEIEAKLVSEEMQKEIEREIARKLKLADENITRAKNAAIENIRKQAVDNAISAATQALKEEFTATKNSEKLVEKSLRLISRDIT